MPKWREKLGKFLSSRTSLPVAILLVVIFASAALAISSYQGKQNAQAAAVSCYWLGTTSTSWNNAANWSSSSGGSASTCDSGANVPGSDDTAIFTSAGNNPANVDVNVNIRGININSGYTNTISQDAGKTVDLGSNGFIQADGTYSATEIMTITTGTTNAFIKTGGTFNEGTGLVTFAGTGDTYNINAGTGSETFNNVTVNMTAASSTLTLTSGTTMVVTGTLTFTNGIINTGTVTANGAISQGAGFDGGSAIVNFGAVGAQVYTINGGTGPVLRFNDTFDASDSVLFTADGGLFGLSITAGFGANPVPMDYGVGPYNLTLGNPTTAGTTGFSQAEGTFTASATFTITNGGTGAFIKTGGTFVEGTGTVVFSGADNTYNINAGTGSETFNNVTESMNPAARLTVTSGTTMVVNGTLTLTDGDIRTGTVTANADISQASTFDGGSATLDFGNDALVQTYTMNGGTGPTLRFDADADKNDKVLFTASSSLYGLTIAAGFGANPVPMDYGVGPYNLTIGDASVGSGAYTQAQGTFTPPAVLTINSGTGGVGVFTKTGGTFVEGTGSVVFSGYGGTYNIDGASAGTETFNNVTISLVNNNDLTISSGDTMLVSGTLLLTEGNVNTGTMEAQGHVTAASTYDGGSASLKFSGAATQTFTLTGATSVIDGDVTVNKSGGQVNLASALVMDAASQDLTIQEGVFDLNNQALTVNGTGATGTLIVENGGTLQLMGGEAITANATYPQLQAGSTVKYDGTAGPYTLKNYTYSNLTIDGSGATFNLPAATVVGGNLNITNGILDAVSGSNFALSVAGDWSNTGTFTPQAGTVTLNGTNQAVNGSTTFSGFTKADTTDNSTDVILTFQVGQTQTISGLLTFNGLDTDDRVNLVSSTPTSYWYLTASGTFAIDYVDVTDSNAGGGLTVVNTFTVNGGHNINWQFVPGAPTIGVATAGAGVGQATVTFTPPADDGIPITGYTVTSTPSSITGTGAGSPITVSGLANGTAYTFTVHATNANGDGPESAASNSITTFAVPGAPTIGVATAGAGVGQATVTFSAPGSDGGTPITGYTVTSTPGSFTGTGAGSPITVSGLANGTAYTFKVYATNIVGDGPESAASNSITTFAVPGAPTIGVATAGNAQASITFAAPGSDGGTPITGYTVTSTPGSFTNSGAGSPIVVGGLTNGTSYTFTVHATNAVGNGPESAASNAVTPSTVPGAPTIGVATPGNAQASVTFTPPGSDGGSAITGYTVTSTPGSFTGAGVGSPIVVGGLTNGTSYTFTVHATNINGDSAESAASNAVIPSTVPGAPTIGVATVGPGAGQATVTFTPPVSDGGSAITGYTVTSTPSSITGTGAGSPITVSGLANGTAYTFTVHATNINGNSAESAASNSITTFAVPGAPTIGVATGGNAQASVTFVAPGSDGGSVITGYTVTSTPGSFTNSGAGSPIVVGGLTNGVSYTFTVHATNAVGNGPESAASNAVVPSTVPDAPTGILAVAGNAQAQVAFTAPADGGSPITGYTVTSTPGSITASGLLSPITVNGLTNGTSYTFTVHATNANGNGPESAPSNAVTPSAPAPPATSCNNNGIQDNGETGIDCGGGNCLACQELRLHMTSPKLNDSYYLGGSLPIKWKIGFGADTSTYSNSPSVITQLEISTDGGNTFRFIKNLLPADMSPNDPVYLAHHAGQTYGHYSAVGIVGLQGSFFAYDWQLPIDQTLAGDQIKIRLTPKVYDSGTPITPESSRNFKITSLSNITIAVAPDESVIAPGGNINYTAKVYDQDNHDITSSCPVTWSMQVPVAGSINGSGLLAATPVIGIWIDSVKGQANCGGLSDFQLVTFVTTTEARRLSYVWANPWSATVKDPVKNANFNVWGYDQFGLRLPAASYSFSLLDSKIGYIPTNGRVVDIATSNNYGCYPNKIKSTASYNGVEMSSFGSVAIYPPNYAYNSGGSNCNDSMELKDKILASLTGAMNAYAAEGQIFTSVSYETPKYFRPGQVGAFKGVPRDQLATSMDGVSVEYILRDPNAGALAKDGKFIATTNLGSYPNAIEIRASLGGTVISNTFSVTVTNERRRATIIRVWGPTGATELTSKRVFKMWKGSNYSFYSVLRDQFGDTISGQLYARTEDVSGNNLVNILGPTTLSANNTEGVFNNAIKVTYDIDRINQTIVYDNEKIDGSSPALYLTLDINAKNDDPAVCLYAPHKICDPLDPGCVTVCTGNSCNGGGIGGIIADIVAFLVNLFGDALMKAISIAVLAIVAAISLLLALLSLLANLLPFLQSTHIFSMFAKSKDRKNAKGLIYEAASGLPIPGVKVLLFRARDQKLQAVATSDKDGKFALAVPPGEEYYLQTKSFGYDQVKENRSQVLQKYGLKYSNNYFGERFSSRDTIHYFDRQVPMAANANADAQAAKIHRVEVISKILRILNAPLLIVGFSFSLIVFYSNKSVFNSIVVGLYIAIFVYYIVAFFIIRGRSYGLVYKKTDNSPIDQAIVRAISETTGKLVRTTVSDVKGRYALALPRGYYNIVVTKANLQQEEISRSRIKSNFSPTKEKIQLSETQIASVADRPMPPAEPIIKTGAPARTSLDAAEIIEKYNPEINSKEIQPPILN